MNAETTLAIDLTINTFCWIVGTCFVVWLTWTVLRRLSNYLFIRSLRIGNRELNQFRRTPDFRVGGDCK